MTVFGSICLQVEVPDGSTTQSPQRLRRLPERTDEGTPHPLGIVEARSHGDPLNRFTGVFNPLAGRFQPHPLDRLRRTDADVPGKSAGEVARAHRHTHGELLDCQPLRQVGAHPVEQRREGSDVAAKLGQSGKLRLPARAAVVDDHLLRHAPRDGLAQIIGDERQRQIDPRADPRGGPDLAITYMDAIGFDPDVRKLALELFGAAPMGRGPTPVEQTRSIWVPASASPRCSIRGARR